MRGLITGPELARIEKVSPSTIWRWTVEKFIPEDCVRTFGHKRPIARYSVEALQRRGFLTATPELLATA